MSDVEYADGPISKYTEALGVSCYAKSGFDVTGDQAKTWYVFTNNAIPSGSATTTEGLYSTDARSISGYGEAYNSNGVYAAGTAYAKNSVLNDAFMGYINVAYADNNLAFFWQNVANAKANQVETFVVASNFDPSESNPDIAYGIIRTNDGTKGKIWNSNQYAIAEPVYAWVQNSGYASSDGYIDEAV